MSLSSTRRLDGSIRRYIWYVRYGMIHTVQYCTDVTRRRKRKKETHQNKQKTTRETREEEEEDHRRSKIRNSMIKTSAGILHFTTAQYEIHASPSPPPSSVVSGFCNDPSKRAICQQNRVRRCRQRSHTKSLGGRYNHQPFLLAPRKTSINNGG